MEEEEEEEEEGEGEVVVVSGASENRPPSLRLTEIKPNKKADKPRRSCRAGRF